MQMESVSHRGQEGEKQQLAVNDYQRGILGMIRYIVLRH